MAVPGSPTIAASSVATDENTSFVVSPDYAAIAWTVGALVWAAVVLFCAWRLVQKRRWEWFAVGLLTGGAAWLAGPFVEAAPGSPWTRRVAR